MSFASLRRVLRSARKGLCSTCSKTKYPQLEAAGAGHVGCLIYTMEVLGQLIRDENNVTAMHVAARKGQVAILIYLVENDLVDEVPRAKNGATPAHDAAGTGNLECLRYILETTKASVADVDENNATPLHWAVQSGRVKTVQWLVLNRHSPIDAIARGGITPIHIAAAKKHLDVLKWLVGFAYKHYPKPRRLLNAKDRNGATPLYHAAHAGNLEVIQWLSEKGGGDPTIFSTQGLAPLHAATIAGHLSCVKYLFQFGSATAPGGLRTTEGACTLHFAAADGHLDIMKWLLKQKECSGNERDYYQSTPMHDAAEHGHLKIIQLLCEHQADYTLTDVEGSTPLDLAQKNGHSKCTKYLTAVVNHKVPRGANSSSARRSNLSRTPSRQKAEMIDSYSNAPPHQLPVNVFEGDDDHLDMVGLEGTEDDEQWETLRDLMDVSEIHQLDHLKTTANAQLSAEEKKRRKLEEKLRKEAEERQKRKKILQQREEQYEKEIRDRLLAEGIDDQWEEGVEGPSQAKEKKRRSDPHGLPTAKQQKRLSLPSKLQADETQAPQRGLVERMKQEFELKTPNSQKGSKRILGKLWPGKRSTSIASNAVAHSQSWDSYLSQSRNKSPKKVSEEIELENIPDPPPPPTVEYLLGKRPVGLRKRISLTLKEEIASRVTSIGADQEDSEAESEQSSVSSAASEHKSHHTKKKKKREKSQKLDEPDWQYNKLTVPRSSPPRERKRKLTPIPSHVQPRIGDIHTLSAQKLDFDQEGNRRSTPPPSPNSPSAASPSSLSPSTSLSPLSSPSPTFPTTSSFGFLNPSFPQTLPASPPASAPDKTTAIAESTGKQALQPVATGTGAPVSSADLTQPQAVPPSKQTTQPKRAARKLLPHLQQRQFQADSKQVKSEAQQKQEHLQQQQKQQQQAQQQKQQQQQVQQGKQQQQQQPQQQQQGRQQQQRPQQQQQVRQPLVQRGAPVQKLPSKRRSGHSRAAPPAPAPGTTSVANASRQGIATTHPDKFMKVLNEVISTSTKQPLIMRQAAIEEGKKPSIVRQLAMDDGSPPPSPGQQSPTLDEIELELDAMKTALANVTPKFQAAPRDPTAYQRPPLHKQQRPVLQDHLNASDSGSESSDSSSSSDDSSTSDSDSSSDDEMIQGTPVRQPIMARNRAMGNLTSPKARGFGGISRARLMAKYPRLLRKKPIRLATIFEVPEEIVHEAETPEGQADLFYKLYQKKLCMKAWRRYMQIMKSASRKAEKMAQRKRRDLLARSFYAWIQVRNMGTVEKDELEMAKIYFERKLMKRVLDAWLSTAKKVGVRMPIAKSSSRGLLTAEDRYINWMNQYLKASGKYVEDLQDSLADGTLIILALENISGKKAPRHNLHPKVRLHRIDNWKVAHGFMSSLGINVKGIEPADLGNVAPAAIHNTFNQILKWSDKRSGQLTFL